MKKFQGFPYITKEIAQLNYFHHNLLSCREIDINILKIILQPTLINRSKQ